MTIHIEDVKRYNYIVVGTLGELGKKVTIHRCNSQAEAERVVQLFVVNDKWAHVSWYPTK